MIGNRTRSTVALARHQAAATAQNVAATVVRSASDAAVSQANTAMINQELQQQREDLLGLNERVGNLEDIP